ncbi:hypothetical protein L2E82_25461 [Cichorium intybus]|uniref:Uncharacterized protein n=1 Tax=Cichorium intybus TaxID=13427 RepID=A0ACB9E3C2_CICIN|nr:hypothetical protein L2E82_25461 [Cichorium intybus]
MAEPTPLPLAAPASLALAAPSCESSSPETFIYDHDLVTHLQLKCIIEVNLPVLDEETSWQMSQLSSPRTFEIRIFLKEHFHDNESRKSVKKVDGDESEYDPLSSESEDDNEGRKSVEDGDESEDVDVSFESEDEDEDEE